MAKQASSAAVSHKQQDIESLLGLRPTQRGRRQTGNAQKSSSGRRNGEPGSPEKKSIAGSGMLDQKVFEALARNPLVVNSLLTTKSTAVSSKTKLVSPNQDTAPKKTLETCVEVGQETTTTESRLPVKQPLKAENIVTGGSLINTRHDSKFEELDKLCDEVSVERNIENILQPTMTESATATTVVSAVATNVEDEIKPTQAVSKVNP